MAVPPSVLIRHGRGAHNPTMAHEVLSAGAEEPLLTSTLSRRGTLLTRLGRSLPVLSP